MKFKKGSLGFMVLAGFVAASACSQEELPSQGAGEAGAGSGGGSAGKQNGDVGSSPTAGRGDSGQAGSSAGTGGDSGATSAAGDAGRGGSGGTAAREGDGGAGAGATHPPFPCKSPRSLDGGYVACATDAPDNFVFEEFSEVRYSYLHRPTTGTCPNGISYDGEPGEQGVAGAAGAGGYGWGDPCTSNVDCGRPNYCGTTQPRNYCDDGIPGPSMCKRGCETDADCGEQSICLCGDLFTLPGSIGTCVPATCKTDADCEAGYRCASTFHEAYEIRFSCQTPGDECAGSDDCVDSYEPDDEVPPWASIECTGGARRTCTVVKCAYDWGIGW